MTDIHTPSSSDGASVLLSIFVDYASTSLRPEMSLSQRLSVAQLSRVTAPQRLLRFLKNRAEAESFVDWALLPSTIPPPVLETMLHPGITPGLVFDDKKRARLTEETDALRSDRLTIIKVFVECFYPASYSSGLRDCINKASLAQLDAYIATPGGFVQEMRQRKHSMVFAPPKWYRLSIHPNMTIQKSPQMDRGQLSLLDAAFPVPFSSLECFLPLTATELLGQLGDTQRNTLLSILPTAFTEISESTVLHLPDMFTMIHKASPNDLRQYILRDREQRVSVASALTIAEGDIDTPTDKQLYIFHVRLETSDRLAPWEGTPGAVLRKWMSAVAPVMETNAHYACLVSSIFDRTCEKCPIGGNSVLTDQQLEFFTYNARPKKRPSKFEFWIKTTCAALDDLKKMRKSGPSANSYVQGLQNASIWVACISKFWDNVCPVVMLVNSLEHESDSVIRQELEDRLDIVGVPADAERPLYVAWCSVGVSTGHSATMVKCIMAYSKGTDYYHQAFRQLPVAVSRSRYLVTRDYSFAPITLPPTDKSDKELTTAIRTQRELVASLTHTMFRGFDQIDLFCHVLPQTRTLQSDDLKTNSRSLAALIMLGPAWSASNSSSDSPVARVTSNTEGTAILLHGKKTDAEALVSYTLDIVPLMELWLGHRGVTCEVNETSQYISNADLHTTENTALPHSEGGDISQSTRLVARAGNATTTATRLRCLSCRRGTQRLRPRLS